jgi:hypothetical protein
VSAGVVPFPLLLLTNAVHMVHCCFERCLKWHNLHTHYAATRHKTVTCSTSAGQNVQPMCGTCTRLVYCMVSFFMRASYWEIVRTELNLLDQKVVAHT